MPNKPKFSVYLNSYANIDHISDEFLEAHEKWAFAPTGELPKKIETSNISYSDLLEIHKRIDLGWKDGNTINDLRKKADKFINDNDLGGGNFIGAAIRVNATGKVVAYISYNNRVWWGDPWTEPRKPMSFNDKNVYELDLMY